MSRGILKNFRGQRALIVQQDTAGRTVLVRTLTNLGLDTRIAVPGVSVQEDLVGADVIFLDIDEGIESILQDDATAEIPVIALVGSETPSRLGRAVRARAASHIQKPVRSSGVFTALFLAMNEHTERSRLAEEKAVFRRRLGGRKTVVKAVLTLMTRWGIDDDEAYGRLRREAMRQRVNVETVAQSVLDLGGSEIPGKRKDEPSDRTGGAMTGPSEGLSIRGDQE